MHVGHKEIADCKDQIAGSSVSNRHLIASAKTVEDRNANPEEGNLQPLRRLASVRVRHDEVGSSRTEFEIFKIAQQDLFSGYCFEYRRLCCSNGGLNLAAHLM